MALVTEDGTGLATAESYQSVADADTYWSLRASDPQFATWDASSTAEKEEALRVSTQEVDAENSETWKGTKGSSAQALDWPRVNAFDANGYAFSSVALPTELVSYTAERAARYRSNILTGLIPDVDAPAGGITREKLKAGPVELDTTYAGSASPIKQYPKLTALLSGLVFGGGTVVRA